ncbi:hypothetical protein B0H19DRAFT_1261259 [Mycena capillaripes]|nr:hypothetical protein B0H19DRAFT_1261259 [Mycena capillaripes]
MSLELPPEIWITVFEYLPRSWLLALRTVSSLFNDLSPGILYRQFNYRPSAYVQDGSSGLVGRELDRLTFWASDKIASHVRTCHVSYAGPVVMHSRSPVFNALFETVSRFSNLRALSCNLSGSPVELCALRVENLRHLRTLHIHGGPLSCPDKLTSFKISVQHFGYTDIFLPHLPSEGPHFSCLSMLDLAILRSLELGAGHSLGLEHFLSDSDTVASFNSLRTLSISFSRTDLPRIHACIAPFPAIEDLILDLIQTWEADTYTVPPTPLAPQLNRYKGPAMLLPLVLPGSQPTQLTITRGSAAELLGTLTRMIYDPKSITALAIRVVLHGDVCEGTTLLELLALFPCLTRLALNVSSDNAALETFDPHNTSHVCERLANLLTVPPALRNVVFRWRLARNSDAEVVPDVSQLADRMRRLNPGLEVVFSRLSADVWGF